MKLNFEETRTINYFIGVEKMYLELEKGFTELLERKSLTMPLDLEEKFSNFVREITNKKIPFRYAASMVNLFGKLENDGEEIN